MFSVREELSDVNQSSPAPDETPASQPNPPEADVRSPADKDVMPKLSRELEDWKRTLAVTHASAEMAKQVAAALNEEYRKALEGH